MRTRERLIVVLVVLTAAGLALLAAGRPWVTQDVSDVPGVRVVTASGDEAAPAVPALALVAGAGGVALLVAGRIGRRPAGLAIGLAGLGVLAAAVGVITDPRSAAAAAVPAATGRTGPLPDPAATSPWAWLTLVAALVLVACGAVAVLRSGSWPGAGRRFEPATGSSGAPSGPGVESASRAPASSGSPGTPADAVTAWDALSRGEDPTA